MEPAWDKAEGPYLQRLQAALDAAAATVGVPLDDFLKTLDDERMSAVAVDKLIEGGHGPDLRKVIRINVPRWVADHRAATVDQRADERTPVRVGKV